MPRKVAHPGSARLPISSMRKASNATSPAVNAGEEWRCRSAGAIALEVDTVFRHEAFKRGEVALQKSLHALMLSLQHFLFHTA
jgi:hypothetical protein